MKGDKQPNYQGLCSCPSKNVIKHAASKTTGVRSRSKCLFEYIGANVAHIYAKNGTNVSMCKEGRKEGRNFI